MKRNKFFALGLFTVSLLILSGCAGSKEAAVHPLAGSWEYSVDTPQGVFTGIIAFMDTEGMLSGTIAGSDAPDQLATLEDVSFDSEASTITFKFDSGEMGEMIVNATVTGGNMEGLLTVVSFGADVPLVASKQAP